MASFDAAGTETSRAREAVKKTEKTKVVRVKQEYIDYLLAHPPKTFRGMPKEILDLEDELRDLMASVTAGVNKVRDEQLAILEQYHLKGYAEEEIEVTDDDVTVGN